MMIFKCYFLKNHTEWFLTFIENYPGFPSSDNWKDSVLNNQEYIIVLCLLFEHCIEFINNAEQCRTYSLLPNVRRPLCYPVKRIFQRCILCFMFYETCLDFGCLDLSHILIAWIYLKFWLPAFISDFGCLHLSQRWKNVQTLQTRLCYFFSFAVLIFWLYTRKLFSTVLKVLC